jgi:Meiosis-specific coiled-coil domain-containing protein MEIOC
MENLRGIIIPVSIQQAMAQLMDGVMKVQACRQQEIFNAINRHQSRDASQMQKEKGLC